MDRRNGKIVDFGIESSEFRVKKLDDVLAKKPTGHTRESS